LPTFCVLSPIEQSKADTVINKWQGAFLSAFPSQSNMGMRSASSFATTSAGFSIAHGDEGAMTQASVHSTMLGVSIHLAAGPLSEVEIINENVDFSFLDDVDLLPFVALFENACPGREGPAFEVSAKRLLNLMVRSG
jgi:hypothetical protein